MNLAQIEQLGRLAEPRFHEKITEAQDLAQRLSREIRTTSYLLHPPLLDENGIASALRWYIEGLSERTGLKIEFSIPEDFARLPREVELTMFRIVQESLTNILRHSGSQTASIRIGRDGDDIRLEIADQGKGIPQQKLAAINDGFSGVGTRGMRDRVHHLNGNMIPETARRFRFRSGTSTN